jgi:hypothetical protein
VDVQHQIGHGRLGEGLLRADRDPEPGLAEAAHPGQPDVELGLELVERGGRAVGVLPVSYDAAGAPKCAALRAASTPTMT